MNKQVTVKVAAKDYWSAMPLQEVEFVLLSGTIVEEECDCLNKGLGSHKASCLAKEGECCEKCLKHVSVRQTNVLHCVDGACPCHRSSEDRPILMNENEAKNYAWRSGFEAGKEEALALVRLGRSESEKGGQITPVFEGVCSVCGKPRSQCDARVGAFSTEPRVPEPLEWNFIGDGITRTKSPPSNGDVMVKINEILAFLRARDK